MKIFKTLIFGLFLSFIVFSCANEEYTIDSQEDALRIGKIVDGDFKFDNLIEFSTRWEERLKKDGYDVKLTNFEIDYTEPNSTGITETILKAQSEDEMVKTAIIIKKVNNEYFESATTETVVCTGDCQAGCDPKKIVSADGKSHRWICTSCIPNHKKCKKTVTISEETPL